MSDRLPKQGDTEVYSKEPNDICKDCLFWKQFNSGCFVYWYRKKFCTMRVSDSAYLEETKSLFKIDQL